MYPQLILEDLEHDYESTNNMNNIFWFECLFMWVCVMFGLCARHMWKDLRKDL